MRDGKLALMRPVMTSPRALRCQDQVNTCCTSLLGDACHRGLDFLAGHHHQVSKLVDQDDDEGQFARPVGHVVVAVAEQLALALLDGL